MVANFLWAQGNSQGYLSAAPTVVTATTSSNTSMSAISPTLTAVKGTAVTGVGVTMPNCITGTVSTSATATLLTAAGTSQSGGSFTFWRNPVLIGGEATALTNGSALTSSYWNGSGIFTQTADNLYGLYDSVFLIMNGAFSSAAVVGGCIVGWFLPSWDGGVTFETVVATASATVPALSRSPDFVISLDNNTYASGNIRFANGRITLPPPEAAFKVLVQNMSGQTMPSVTTTKWMIMMGPSTLSY